jgi:hypothetical protein
MKVESRRGEQFHFHLHLLRPSYVKKRELLFGPGTILTWRDFICNRGASYALVSGPCIKPSSHMYMSRAYTTSFTANTALAEEQVRSSCSITFINSCDTLGFL